MPKPWILAFCINVASGLVSAPADRPNMTVYKDGKAKEAAAKDAVASKDAKMAAVKKVVAMLTDLRSKVLEEGEKEAQTYNKFACFCKDTTSDKTAAIKAGTDEQTRLTALIGELSGDATGRAAKDKSINDLSGKITKAEAEKKENAKQFAKDKKAYERDLADLQAALYGLEGAIKELKASKNPSLVQIRSAADKVRPAALLADAMGIGNAVTQKATSMLLQQQLDEVPSVPMENYKFHSNDIISTLETLLDDFRKEKTTLSDEFLKVTVKDHEAYQQLKLDELKQLNTELDQTKKERDELIAQVETANAELTTTSASLLDDQEYLKSLAKMCSDTAQTYDQRKRVRTDEIAALTTTLGVLNAGVTGNTTAATIRFVQQAASLRRATAIAQDPVSMNDLEALAEAADAGASLLQADHAKKHLRGVAAHAGAKPDASVIVSELLESQGRLLKSSALTELAQRVKGDVFAKIKILIQELIERLQHEATKDADQKGWCTKATSDAEQKRTYAMEEIAELNAEMAELEAKRDKFDEQLVVLEEEIHNIKTLAAETIKARSEEKAENKETVETAEAGMSAVEQAIDIMTKFYKTAAKETVDFSLAQQSPADEAPEAGFGIGEAYTGAQDAQGGIVGMLEVISSDFERTIKETNRAEAEAEKDHRKFMTKTGVSLAEKDVAEKETIKYKNDAETKLADADASLTSETDTLNTAIKELLELKKACVDTGMSYDERIARRKDEIAALNKADCILEAYAKYGPDGAGEQC